MQNACMHLTLYMVNALVKQILVPFSSERYCTVSCSVTGVTVWWSGCVPVSDISMTSVEVTFRVIRR